MLKSKFTKKILHFYWRFQRPMTLGAFGAVVRDDGAVLLVQTRFSRGLSFPGGGVEAGESASDTLKRELFEEAGVRVHASPQLFSFYFNPRVSRRDHIAFYVVREFTLEARKIPNAEIVDLVWVQPDDITSHEVMDCVHLRFQELFCGSAVSEFWMREEG